MVDYNNFAQTFSQSRKNMKWEEISYFLADFDPARKNILDIWCGNGRLLWVLQDLWIESEQYIWYDLSQGLLEQARKIYPTYTFIQGDMQALATQLPRWDRKDSLFFIACFHHLDTLEKRRDVMRQAYDILQPGGKIYMTNWSLNSEMNQAKYKSSEVSWSENKYGSSDYQIKIWKHSRYYHCFSLSELEYIFLEAGFEILENREFENQKNIISILKKSS